MPERIRANVQPTILVWARESAGFHSDEAAQKIGVTPDRLASWEVGDAQPTINQLRKMASVYKRPLSVFYLSDVPEGFAVMRDFRRLPGEGAPRFSPALTIVIREAQQRRELMLDLYNEIEEQPQRFEFTAAITTSPETVGQQVRDLLEVTYNLQTTWRDTRVAFNAWRERIEKLGVIVFQMSGPEPSEASGFALAADVLPLIAVNRKDVFSRRSFSLLHEFTHLAVRASGVSETDIESNRPPETKRIEVFCNAVAAAALMPRDDFLREPMIMQAGERAREWPDETIELLAKAYGVSREAIVRRLLTFGRATEAFYQRKRKQYREEREQQRALELLRLQTQDFRLNPARETLTNNGAPYVRLVLNSYYQDRITLSEVASFLRMRLKHLPRLEQYLGMG